MKLYVLLIFNSFIGIIICRGQTLEKSVYKDLVIVQNRKFQDLINCDPCILETYDKSNKLIRRAVQYKDCVVGWYQEYYPSGKLKLTGQYKENISGNWQNAYERGLCSVKSGNWIFFNEKGGIIKKEVWKDGEFLSEVPEQPLNEIWKVELLLGNQPLLGGQAISLDDINLIKVVPYFKNKSKIGNNLADTLEISALQRKPLKIGFTTGNVSNVDLKNLMLSRGFDLKNDTWITIHIYNNEKIFRRFSFQVQK